SSMINWILRPLMPPASLISSKRIFTALDEETPYVAATPDRSVCMPSTISVLVTPRVCADASVATAASAATATLINVRYIVFFLLWKVAQLSGCKALISSGPSLRSVGVHAVDQYFVFLVHELALQLHRWRQLIVLCRELMFDQPELLDRLGLCEALIDLLDLRPDQVLHLARATKRGKVSELHVAVLSKFRNVVVVDHQHAGQILAPIADHHRIGDVGRELQLVLEFRGSDVLAAGGDDDVVHAVGNLEVALVVDETDVARMQPAVA